MSDVRVIGVGSPFANDHRAWQVIDSLQEKFFSEYVSTCPFAFVKLDRPGSQLIEFLQGADKVIVIDALAEDRDEAVLVLMPEQLQEETCLISSHGFGVAEALQLAQAMQILPDELLVLGLSPSLELQTLIARCSELLEQAVSNSDGKETAFNGV